MLITVYLNFLLFAIYFAIVFVAIIILKSWENNNDKIKAAIKKISHKLTITLVLSIIRAQKIGVHTHDDI